MFFAQSKCLCPPRDSDEYVSADEFIWYDDFSEAFVRMSMGVFSNNLDWEQVRERERERERKREKERQKKIKREIDIYRERDRHRDGENRESGLCTRGLRKKKKNLAYLALYFLVSIYTS